MARIFLKSSGPKPNPFGTPNFAPSVAMSRGTTFLELPVTTDNGIALGGSSHETGGHPDIMIQFRSDLHRTERQIAVIGWRPLGNKTLSPLTLDDYGRAPSGVPSTRPLCRPYGHRRFVARRKHLCRSRIRAASVRIGRAYCYFRSGGTFSRSR